MYCINATKYHACSPVGSILRFLRHEKGKALVLFTTCDLQCGVVPVACSMNACMRLAQARLATHAKLTGQGRPLHYMRHVRPWRLLSLYDFPPTLCERRSPDCPLTVQSLRVIDSGVALQSREEGEALTSPPFRADRAGAATVQTDRASLCGCELHPHRFHSAWHICVEFLFQLIFNGM